MPKYLTDIDFDLGARVFNMVDPADPQDGATKAYVDATGGLVWAAEQSANFTAVEGNKYPVDTTGGAITVALPAAPPLNSSFYVIDSRANASTNAITIDFSGPGSRLHGSMVSVGEDPMVNQDYGSARFTFLGGTIGWVAESI